MLSEEELERYARHIVLPEVGGAGQQKLKAAKVLVIGAGGLGTETTGDGSGLLSPVLPIQEKSSRFCDLDRPR